MGLRETMNENPKAIAIIIGVIVVVILGYTFFFSGGEPPQPTPAAIEGRKVFFTDDDGKTWFPESYFKVPPFEHGGKQAVAAKVFRCGGKEFVNHMERYTPEAKKRVEEIIAKELMLKDPTAMEAAQRMGLEVKAPGQKDWVKRVDEARALEIMRPKPPAGMSGELEAVMPE